MKKIAFVAAAILALTGCSSGTSPGRKPPTRVQLACSTVDDRSGDLAGVVRRIPAGGAAGTDLPVEGAQTGARDALQADPDVSIGPDIKAYADALQVLGGGAASASGGTTDAPDALAAVKRAWGALSKSCSSAGYTMINTLS